jgi:hypothetical protein
MAKEKYTFNTKLHLCCADNELRPAMSHIHFVGGYAYATNGYVAIKQSIEEYNNSIINPEHLDGKSLHKDSYKAIMGFDIAECKEGGILCKCDDGQEAFFSYTNFDEAKIPNVEGLITGTLKRQSEPAESCGINPKYLEKLFQALNIPEGVQLSFRGKTSAILVQNPSYKDNLGIIMPIMFDGTLF